MLWRNVKQGQGRGSEDYWPMILHISTDLENVEPRLQGSECSQCFSDRQAGLKLVIQNV